MAKKLLKFRIPFLLVATFLVIAALFSGFYTTKRTKEVSACANSSLSEVIEPEVSDGIFEGKKVAIPKLAYNAPENNVLGTTNGERWIEVDLSEQKLRAWEGDNLFLESLVSTGLPWWATPTGEYRVWLKVRATRMEGGQGRYYYNLPNVPYVMFFQNAAIPGFRGYSLHGTYWHNDFGTPRSHGCVNLPIPVAEKLYYWTSPVMPEGKGWTRTDGSDGTRIVIHE